ncbi:unnamed protein product [Gongylonema pulchrum]|uniref:Mannosyltransferase n=1 Tax=Gongylonema pulchrum TaxID=637853 RepID=A0A183EGQ0_9BILA|nr:unnamed protein product [Gongylonema pulchrum]
MKGVLQNDTVINVCIGKEWYRFPSSFFLPSSGKSDGGRLWTAELKFIRSEFAFLLPKPYLVGSILQITRAIPTEMNDMNREEVIRYADIEQCDFLVDLETPDTTKLEPNFAEQRIREQEDARTRS